MSVPHAAGTVLLHVRAWEHECTWDCYACYLSLLSDGACYSERAVRAEPEAALTNARCIFCLVAHQSKITCQAEVSKTWQDARWHFSSKEQVSRNRVVKYQIIGQAGRSRAAALAEAARLTGARRSGRSRHCRATQHTPPVSYWLHTLTLINPPEPHSTRPPRCYHLHVYALTEEELSSHWNPRLFFQSHKGNKSNSFVLIHIKIKSLFVSVLFTILGLCC